MGGTALETWCESLLPTYGFVAWLLTVRRANVDAELLRAVGAHVGEIRARIEEKPGP
jgi:hypothetical protein